MSNPLVTPTSSSSAQPTQKRAQPQPKPQPLSASASSTVTSQPAPKRSHMRRRNASPKPSCSKKEKTLAKYAKKACQNRSKSETVCSSASCQPSTPNTASLMMPLADACSSATSQIPTIATKTTSTSVMTIPQAQNYLLQQRNVSPAPLQPSNPPVPITIDTLAYISEVYDSLFASQVSGSTPLLKNIRSILIKKLLLEHAAQELPFQSILSFEDLISFTILILQRTAILP